MKPSPIDRLLGLTGDGVECRSYGKAMSIHWYPQGAKPGDRCICGERVKDEAAAINHQGRPDA